MVGAGHTRFGALSDGPKALLRSAVQAALGSVDKGLTAKQIDEGYLATLGFGGWQIGNAASLLAEEVGRPGMAVHHVENACASGGFALRQAVQAIRSGDVSVALVAGLEKMTDVSSSRRRYWLGVSGDTEWERLAGLTFPGVYALLASRHRVEYGTSPEALAAVAVKNHDNGALNPNAHLQKRLTMEACLASPRVADPLGLTDCCPVSDGAAAVLLASADIARRLTDTPVWVVGSGAGSDFLAVQDRESLTSLRATKVAAAEAFRHAPFTRAQLDLAEVHDCFTIAEIIALEDLGMITAGRGGSLALAGETTLHGRMPVNPSGGLKAKGHPLGATGVSQLYEIFQQLRDEAGERQVKGAERALAHNVGGSGATATVLLASL